MDRRTAVIARWLPRGPWRPWLAALAALSLLYSMYSLAALHSAGGLMADNAALYARYQAAHQRHIQALINRSGLAPEELQCPATAPVLQTLDTHHNMTQFIACNKIFYNRVPKCGSRSIMSVIKELGKRYNYSTIGAPKPSTGLSFYKDFLNLKEFVSNFSQINYTSIYSRHLHFVNFTKFRKPGPVYINVIRDPISRLSSHYYYKAYGSMSRPVFNPKFNMTLDECVSARSPLCLSINAVIPFLCGHDKRCRNLDAHAVQVAKRTVRESYLTVGLTEDIPAFLEVMEALMPQFFFNASEVFDEIDDSLHQWFKTVKKPPLSPATVVYLRDHLALEYDLYEFTRQRFYTLLGKVRSLRKGRARAERRREKKEFLEWWDTV